MTRQQLFELMDKAGFSTEWAGYQDAQDTFAKYERFANLIESSVRATNSSDWIGAKDSATQREM